MSAMLTTMTIWEDWSYSRIFRTANSWVSGGAYHVRDFLENVAVVVRGVEEVHEWVFAEPRCAATQLYVTFAAGRHVE